MSESIRVIIADDHPLVRKGLRMTLEEMSEDIELIGEACDGASVLKAVEQLQPDVVLMDVRMPGIDGLEALEQIHSNWPEVAVIVLTTYSDDHLVLRALRAGAKGYLLKDCDLQALLQAIRIAAQGQHLIPPDQMQLLLSHVPPLLSEPTVGSVPPTPKEKSPLTEREVTILAAVARGNRNKEIAKLFGISERTVWSYLSTIFAKLNVDSRTSAVTTAIERGLLPNPGENRR